MLFLLNFAYFFATDLQTLFEKYTILSLKHDEKNFKYTPQNFLLKRFTVFFNNFFDNGTIF